MMRPCPDCILWFMPSDPKALGSSRPAKTAISGTTPTNHEKKIWVNFIINQITHPIYINMHNSIINRALHFVVHAIWPKSSGFLETRQNASPRTSPTDNEKSLTHIHFFFKNISLTQIYIIKNIFLIIFQNKLSLTGSSYYSLFKFPSWRKK